MTELRKFVLSISLILIGVSAYAQPSFFFQPTSQIGNNGDVVCVDITVDDFTDLLTLDFEIAFDSTVMSFNGPQNLALPGLDPGDITLAGPGRGRIIFDWEATTAGTGLGQTFPDNQRIVSLCFTLIGSYGQVSNVEIANAPAPFVTRQFSGGRNIGLFTEMAQVAIGVFPLHMNIGTAGAGENGSVCIDVRADNFSDILSFQYSVSWDETVLQYAGVTGLHPSLPGLQPSSFTNSAPGSLSVLYPDRIGTSAVTLPDGETIYQICFDIVGQCDESSTISISEDPVPIDVYNSQSLNPIGLTWDDGQIDVFACGGGLRLIGDVRTSAPGASVCIPFTVQGFQNISAMNFDISWNENILQFTGLNVPSSGTPPTFSAANFDLTNAGTGTITLDWTAFPWTMSNGSELFELCFTVVGSFGVNGAINPDGINGSVIQGNVDIGLNPREGVVVILPSNPLEVTLGSAISDPGTELCVDVTVQDFTELQTVRWSLLWEPLMMRFNRIENFALPNIQPGTFDSSIPGTLGFNWWDVAGSTLNDGDVLYTVCFDVIGQPGDCTPLEVGDFPNPIFVEAEATRGYNIGLEVNPGELCVTDNRSFTLEVGNGTVTPPNSGCVPVTVTGYQNIEQWSVSLAWNPLQFSYSSINNQALTGVVVDASEIAAGRIGLSHTHGSPTSLADGDIVFELCFDVIATTIVCSPILEETRPLPNSVLEAGESKVMVVTPGEVCSEDGLIVLIDTTHPFCSNEASGAIDITVSGASGNYTYEWTGQGVTSNSEDQVGLAEGTYQVTIRDEINPGTFATQTINLSSLNQAPTVDAGRDTLLACDATPLYQLDGTNTIINTGDSFVWRMLQGGTTIVTGETTLEPTVFGVGRFELQVTDAVGCIGRDTVEVQRIAAPTITIIEQSDIPCDGGNVMLEVAVQPGGNYSVSWTTATGAIVGRSDTTAIVVSASGNYVITVTDPSTNCEKQASIGVSELIGNGVADAGDDRLITCDSTTVTIGGVGTSIGSDFEHRWSTLNGAMLGPTTQPTVVATQAGRYYLTVTDVPTGCEIVDSVDVTTAGDLPQVDAGEALAYTCTRLMVPLNGTGDSGTDYTTLWSTQDGVIAAGTETDLNAVAEAPGTYVLTIANTSTGCESSSQVIVRDSTQVPEIQLEQNITIPCGASSVLLDPTYAVDSLGYSFAWVNSATGDTLARTASFAVPFSGAFEMVVSNAATGCANQSSTTVDLGVGPSVQMSASTSEFICGTDSIVLSLTGSEFAGVSSSVSWIGITPEPDGQNQGIYYATRPGSYQAIITTANGLCSDTLDVPVVLTDQRTILSVDAGADLTLDCRTASVDAMAAAPTEPDQIFQWFSPAGSPILDNTSIEGGFSESGIYILTFRDTITSCTGRDTLEVTRLGEDDVEVALGPDQMVDCAGTPINLIANYQTPDNDVQISWVVLSGQSGPLPAVDQVMVSDPGLYEVTVVYNPTGCEARDTIEVTRVDPDFSLSAPTNLFVDCGEQEGVLSATFTPGAGSYTFSWTASSGTITGPSDSLSTLATAGLYSLRVEDTSTGCSETVEVELSANTAADPAIISFSSDPCSTELVFTAESVAGATGVWDVTNGAFTQVDSVTVIIDAAAGSTVSVSYTLSTQDCPNYSTAVESVVTPDIGISAENELVLVLQTTTDTTFNVAANDDISPGAVYAMLNTRPGVSLSNDGVLSLTVSDRSSDISVLYEVCDPDCPDVCASATLLLRFEEEGSTFTGAEIPNAITPNEDGLNDAFIVEPLVRDPAAFPNARLTVFNRWGDILFTQQPYTNDWKGTNNAGENIPQGTYYFVLELQIGSSDIYKGDITILR